MEKEQLEKIKKLLYKENPIAHFCYLTKSGMVYCAESGEIAIIFVVPLNDIGDAKFDPKMDGKLLIRYISTINKIVDN